MTFSIAIPGAPVDSWQALSSVVALPLAFTEEPAAADARLWEMGNPLPAPPLSREQKILILGEVNFDPGDGGAMPFLPVPEPRFLRARIELGLWAVLRHLRRAAILETQQARHLWQDLDIPTPDLCPVSVMGSANFAVGLGEAMRRLGFPVSQLRDEADLESWIEAPSQRAAIAAGRFILDGRLLRAEASGTGSYQSILGPQDMALCCGLQAEEAAIILPSSLARFQPDAASLQSLLDSLEEILPVGLAAAR